MEINDSDAVDKFQAEQLHPPLLKQKAAGLPWCCSAALPLPTHSQPPTPVSHASSFWGPVHHPTFSGKAGISSDWHVVQTGASGQPDTNITSRTEHMLAGYHAAIA